MSDATERLRQQLQFIAEADKLKNIFRRSYISDGSRRENDAEHSWHLCLMALLLSEHANEANVDILKVLKMVIIHDIVEIDAGDTYIYDEAAKALQAARERQAAQRLFGMLPDTQEAEFHRLWNEFESEKSPEARFAKAIDRLHPMMLNYLAKGKTWNENGVNETQVRAVNRQIAEGSDALWEYADTLIRESVANGWLPES
ncbi:MAG: phosphohydrolase [Opitutales bacterium TMED158]|nr:MAG: phosphohydrolase [Opitutales bacterium TMED158]